MQIKKESIKQRIQIGTSSIVLIFTVLCLVVFATLSLASAKADYSLSMKNEQSVKSYYDADSKGEELKEEINIQLVNIAAQTSNDEEFENLIKLKFKEAFNESSNTISCNIEVNSEQFLFIQLLLCNYEEIKEGKENYKVMCWVIKNKVDYEIDNNIPVWSGI